MIRSILLTSSTLVTLTGLAHGQELNYADYEMLFDEPITIGATGTPKRASETPANMTIITADEIRRSGARDVIEILRRVAGVDVQRTEQSSATIGIRGMNIDSGRLRVLINGRDTFRNYEGVTIWASLPVNMEEIRQIEVVRGPSTALYGANAVTGVINIITYKPMFEDLSAFSARIGSEDQYEGAALYTFQLPNNKGGVRLSYGRGEMDHYDADLTPGERIAKGEPDYERANIEAAFQLSERFAGGFNASLFEGPGRIQLNTGDNAYTEIEDRSYGGFLSYRADGAVWTLSANHNDQAETRNTVVVIPGGQEVVLLSSIEAKSTNITVSRVSKPRSDLGLRFSAGYQKDAVPQFGVSAADNTGDVSYTTLFASGLADYTVSPTVSFMASARVDYVDTKRDAIDLDIFAFKNTDFKDYTALSLNMALIWTPDANNLYRFTYSRGFNAPNLFNLGGNNIHAYLLVPGVTDAVGGHPDIDPEYSQQFEAAWERQIPSLNGGFNLSAYLRKDTDIIRRSYVMRLNPANKYHLSSANIGDADTYGFEAQLYGETASNFSWRLNYAYSDTDDDLLARPGGFEKVSDAIFFTEEFLDNRSSQHIVTAQGTWVRNKFWVDGLVQFKSGFDSYYGSLDFPNNPAATRVDDVTIANLTLGYEVNDHVDVTLTGENVFDDFHHESVDPTTSADRRVWATLALRF
ncbi:TonB-dependent receptor plug domain-containing protein [Woodsholea maritima]|uniref:TonB-dependent receptor plug domain-containing protein n=1 Tax=Woodsholea maritima TaxID=240237 RepID=UPI00036E2901|nr:TonB-dependent receptor [Woodsholea maritima]